MRGRKQNPELDQIANLYRKGLSIRKIADRLGRKHQAVYAILKARKVQMRESPSQLNGRKPKDEVLFHRGNR